MDRKNEDNPDVPNSVTAGLKDNFDLLRVEVEDIVASGTDAMQPYKPHGSLVDSNKTDNPADDIVVAWAQEAYADFGIDLVLEADVVDANFALGGGSVNTLEIGRVSGLKLKPMVARDYQGLIPSSMLVRDLDGKVAVGGSTTLNASDPRKDRPTEYRSRSSAAGKPLYNSNVKNAWALTKSDGTKFRQKIFNKISDTIGDNVVRQIKLVVKNSSGGVTHSDPNIFTFMQDNERNNRLFSTVLSGGEKIPQPKIKMDPLIGFGKYTSPAIIDNDTHKRKNKNRYLRIPVTLADDGVQQINIMVAHSDVEEAYFNDLRADNDGFRTFTDDRGVSVGGNTMIACPAGEGSIQFAANAAAIGALVATPATDTDLQTSVTKTGQGAKDLFYLEKFDRGTSAFSIANDDWQVRTTGVATSLATSSSTYSADHSGDYLLYSAIPHSGDCDFLLISISTVNGNNKFVAYRKDDDNNYQRLAAAGGHK